MQVLLGKDRYGMPWTREGSVYARGYVVDSHGKYVTGQAFYEILNGIDTEEKVNDFLKDASGNFAFIIVLKDGSIIAAVDRQRSFPLLYTKGNRGYIISDSIDRIKKETALSVDDKELYFFSKTICAYRNKTVYQDVYQIPPANYIVIKAGDVKDVPYFYYAYTDEKVNYEDFVATYDKVFDRFIEYLDGRQVALPLSGGRDSRLILYHLKKKRYTNIITYSYGYDGTEDQRISKIVADYFKVEYHFVGCQRKNMSVCARKHLKKYLKYAGNSCSLPCVQELYAVYRLKELGLVDSQTVFVPGHGGDFYAGARSFDFETDKPEELRKKFLDRILYREYRIQPKERHRIIKRMEETGVCPEAECFSSRRQASEILERYYFTERESKYIQNCVRYYDYYGFDWCTPLLDTGLTRLWLSVPWEDRVNRKYYDEMTKRIYPEDVQAIEYAEKPVTHLSLKWCYGLVSVGDFLKCKLSCKEMNMNQYMEKKYERCLFE